jgi:alpha-amylase/alpha-mannosidase (GH57 family)
MERYVCVHGHFYQPPRENPWLEAVEIQDSAYPYHDWNERITAECYAPNAVSRIMDGEGRITEIVNNYSKISFNFGPTLLAWLEVHAPDTYRAVLAADVESMKHFGGHGSALAQAYNHVIMPLANRRDKETQILWGLRDFEKRFGRKPEGMWLPEAAVDLETLEILAEHGIRFTILAPRQARRVRLLGGRAWRDVSGGRIDPSMAYRQRLASGRQIDIFFYDGPISQAVAFEGLLDKGEYLAGRLMSGYSESRSWPQLVHIATDGETYGHHHPHGDMALASALRHIESNNLAKITNYAQFLELHPPTHEVEIFENSSWSCVHGIERWKSHCGCNSGGHPGWTQEWRGPLREALDWLRDALVPRFEAKGAEFFDDPWTTRNDYIDVILDRGGETAAAFFGRHSRGNLASGEKIEALKLLELQRHAMLMYTSCGWFFDELSGIETAQVIQYAGRALQLSNDLFRNGLEPEFLNRLEKAKGNLPEQRDGRLIYEKFVRPMSVNLEKAAAHYAVSSLFEDYGDHTRIFCYEVVREDHKLMQAGKVHLHVGRVKITSQITLEFEEFTFGVIHLGDHSISGGIRPFRHEDAYQSLLKEVSHTFDAGDLPELIREVDKNFGLGTYSLKLLFRDQQRKILRQVLEGTLAEADALYRRFYEEHALLFRSVTEYGLPLPRRLTMAAEFVLNSDMQRAFESQELDRGRIDSLLMEAQRAGITLDSTRLEFVLRRRVEELIDALREQPEDLAGLRRVDLILDLAGSLPFKINLWKPQNIYYEMARKLAPQLAAKASGSEEEKDWFLHFSSVGDKLRVSLPKIKGDAGA